MTEPMDIVSILVTFGSLFLLRLLADLLGRHTPLPRVTLLRVAGFLIGPSALDWLPSFTERWFPVLTHVALPQAGVAIGMALLASQRFPDLEPIVLPVVLGSTVIFELIGPIVTRWTLSHVGDIPARSQREESEA